ncbi:DUF3775 domain-containing protein [Paucisalibacillus globulus]|uniref:DUF3775 domain-containing protein n=1 Tax=Paucisalibacillus globulus TaxID=351095 RepID=UPI000BB7737F|nr:DUF3775 domain-containing protein [Paucisalibacillus globulus]
MLEITETELTEVIALAEALRKSSENYSKSPKKSYKERFLDEDLMSPEFKDLTDKENTLSDYLRGLSIGALQDLLAIMYLGRDKDYNKRDSARTIMKKQRAYFDNQIGPNQIAIITTLMEKRPLDDYLKVGVEILRIHV